MRFKGVAAVIVLGFAFGLFCPCHFCSAAEDDPSVSTNTKFVEDSSGDPIFVDYSNLPKEIRLKKGQELYFVTRVGRVGGGLSKVDVAAFGNNVININPQKSSQKMPAGYESYHGIKAVSSVKMTGDAVLTFVMVARVNTYSTRTIRIKLLGK